MLMLLYSHRAQLKVAPLVLSICKPNSNPIFVFFDFHITAATFHSSTVTLANSKQQQLCFKKLKAASQALFDSLLSCLVCCGILYGLCRGVLVWICCHRKGWAGVGQPVFISRVKSIPKSRCNFSI